MASKADTLKEKITEAIKSEDSSIVMNFVLISVVKKGGLFSSTLEVQISGRVERESDLAKVNDIAKANAGNVAVVSTLRFKA
ncbi:MAG: hypothetical protein B6241_02255 [Spirochaetaceae bacterium 4572_59]|nr:MAG: hypothetical protein B6241_02255 [Spirochaetaceae bacterium 4572_59]